MDRYRRHQYLSHARPCDSHADRDFNSNRHTPANRYSDADKYGHGVPHCFLNAYSHAVANSDGHRLPSYGHVNIDLYADRLLNANRYGHGDGYQSRSHRHTDGDFNSDLYTSAHKYRNINKYGYSVSNRFVNSYSHGHANRHGDTNPNSD